MVTDLNTAVDLTPYLARKKHAHVWGAVVHYTVSDEAMANVMNQRDSFADTHARGDVPDQETDEAQPFLGEDSEVLHVAGPMCLKCRRHADDGEFGYEHGCLVSDEDYLNGLDQVKAAETAWLTEEFRKKVVKAKQAIDAASARKLTLLK